MTVTVFPNGQVLTSSALTEAEINAIFQSLTCGMLGIPTGDPLNNTAVRIAWQQQGAPAWTIGTDVCSLRAVEEKNDYNLIRDLSYVTKSSTLVTKKYEYTRVWKISFTLRGPNAFDHARLIKSALLLDWTHDSLSASNLYLLTDLETPLRVPELFEGKWWEVVDYYALFNEQVNESLDINSVSSVPIEISNSDGIQINTIIT
jgi:hypothetical protein